MFNLSLVAYPWSPPETRDLPVEDRPVFMLRPAMSGEIMDARAAAYGEVEKPTEQETFCPGCGHAFTVPVVKRTRGEMDNGRFGHRLVAGVIVEVRNLSVDGEPLIMPTDVAARVAIVRRLPADWVAGMASASREDSEIDPEEE